LGAGACELDPAEAWTAVVEAAREALVDVAADELGAIGITSQRTGVVFLDEEGTELFISPNADGRGVGPGVELEREYGELVYRIAGRLPVMLYLPARLAALKLADPERASRIAHALSLSDWAVRKLTGVAATEATQAAEMLVYDLASRAWSDELCSCLDVSVSLLPEIHPLGQSAGDVTREAAWELSLPAGLPTVAGGSDTQAAALAMGVVEPGQAVVVAGSTMLCEQPMAEPTIDDAKRLWTSPHLSGGFVAEAHCGESGIPIQWMANLLGETKDWIDKTASEAEPGAGGLFFLDPAPSTVGDFPLIRSGSLSFPAPLLALARPRRDVARAVLEGVAFAAAAGLEWTQQVAGPLQDLAVTGGVARSRTFARILASALNRPVRVAREPLGSALGAAVVAAAGAETHGSVHAAADAMADRGDEVEPVPEWISPAAGAYAGWRERVQRMDDNAIRVSHMIGRA
jgi:xylulokinase